MEKIIKYFLIIFVSAFIGMVIERDTAYGLSMTIDAIEDAGQAPGQENYVQFRYGNNETLVITTAMVPSRWASADEVKSFADSQNITGWKLESAGNIWSSDPIIGDALTGLHEGIYRISVLNGAFMYDSFGSGWSPYENEWRWQLHIQALRAIIDGEIKDYFDFMLGSIDPYDTSELALQASLGDYLDIRLADGGSLIFWIWDNPNSSDNFGSLSVGVVLIPEPSTFILVGTGLLLLLRRYRKHMSAH